MHAKWNQSIRSVHTILFVYFAALYKLCAATFITHYALRITHYS